MYGEAVKRLIMLLAFVIAIITLIINLLVKNSDIFNAAFNALCVMFISAIILFYTVKCVSFILFEYLQKGPQNSNKLPDHGNKKDYDGDV